MAYFQSKSSLEKKLFIVSGVLAVLTLSFIIALAAVASSKNKTTFIEVTPTSGSLTTGQEVVTTASSDVTTGRATPTTEPPGVPCQTLACLKAAVMILENMNETVDPCDNFYEFACGRWDKNTVIPEDKGRYGVFDELRDDLSKTCIEQLDILEPLVNPTGAIDKSQAFYKSCITTEDVSIEDGVKQLRELLDSVNVTLTLAADNPNATFDTLILSKMVKQFGLNFILSFSVDADDKKTTNNVIILDQPESFGLSKNVLVNGSDSDRINAYKKFMRQTFCLPGLATNGTCDAADAVDEMYKFEVEIAKKSRSAVDRRSALTWYHPMPLEELLNNVPKIPFMNYIKDILEEKGNSVTNQTVVIVKEMKYFQEVANILESARGSVVQNYLGGRLIQSLGPSLFKHLRDLQFEFDQINGGIKKQKSNEDRCFDQTNTYFGHAVGRLYVDKKFDESAKKKVEDMVTNLADAFRQLVNNNTWMDEETRDKSKLKLEKMIEMMGYPDWTKDNAKLDEYYSGLSPMDQSNFFENFKNVLEFTEEKVLKKISKTNNRTADWVTQASIVNAYYNPSANSITFPAGILQVPFYGGERPKALNYGAIGYVIGHEITHGYDDQGSEYDGDGNLFDWWTNKTRIEFDERKQCFIDQYSKIKDQLSGKNLNGAQTIGENIADNGGIREAYNAYLLSGRERVLLPGLEAYNDQKLFYISAANVWCTKFRKAEMENQIDQGVHSPGMYRAYVPLANSQEFADVFQCPEGSTMNPKDRCVIW